MSNIPKAQEKLREAKKLIAEALALMPRRVPVRKAAPVSQRMTKELRRRILSFADAHPSEPLHKIAERFNVNPGRISEILTR